MKLFQQGGAGCLVAFSIAAGLLSGGRAQAATYAVDKTTDGLESACTAAANDCSLRGAIIAADANPDSDVINLQAAATYTLTVGPSDSTVGAYDPTSGDLDITSTVIINGNGASINGGALDRVFDIGRQPSTVFSVTMNSLTVTNGLPKGFLSFGGGINVRGANLNLIGCRLASNSTGESGQFDNGGGLAFNGLFGAPAIINLSVIRTTITGNQGGNGGGIAVGGWSSVTIQDSVIDNNAGKSSQGGGGLFVAGSRALIKVKNSTVASNNTSDIGAGGGGLGLFNSEAVISSATIANNNGIYGGGARANGGTIDASHPAQLTTYNSLWANSAEVGAEAYGAIISSGFNLFKSSSGLSGSVSSDKIDVDPLLDALGLGNNGGPTRTVLLQAASPAVDAGDPGFDAVATPSDQRGAGFVRVSGNRVDIGAYEVKQNTPPVNLSVAPASGSSVANTARTLTTTYSDVDGGANIRLAYFLVNTAVGGGGGALFGYYDPVQNKIFLRNDAGTAWSAGATPGTVGAPALTNSQGSLNVEQTTVSVSGNNLVVNWNFTPLESFSGAKNLFMYCYDASNAAVGWEDKGDWSITIPNHAPVNVSVSPNSGSSQINTPRNITSTYRDVNGAGDIQLAYFLVNSAVGNGGGALFGYYDRTQNKIFLRNDAGTAWSVGSTPGTPGAAALTNSQGALNVAQTFVSLSGTDLIINWNFTPASGFLGAKNLFMYCYDTAHLVAGWDDRGDWNISLTNNAPANTSVTPTSGSSSVNSARTMIATYSDPDGGANLRLAYFLVNSAVGNGGGALFGYYDPVQNKLFLRNDAGNAWSAGITPGTATTLSNSQGTLNVAQTTVSVSGNDLVINWNFTPSASFTGAKNLFMYCYDTSSATAGWDDKGDWTINLPGLRDPSGKAF